ncbi:MAG: RNA polymerase sigma factor [Pseudomonadota bacterium]
MPDVTAEVREAIVALLPRLRRFAYSLTGSVADADDLLQATVERLLTRRIPRNADVSRWSFTLCRNLWIDELRSRSIRRSEPEADVDILQDGIDPDREIVNRITISEVRGALDELPEGQRLALSLVTVEGYSYAEAAEILDVPIGTIMSRIARARRNLAEKLEQK